MVIRLWNTLRVIISFSTQGFGIRIRILSESGFYTMDPISVPGKNPGSGSQSQMYPENKKNYGNPLRIVKGNILLEIELKYMENFLEGSGYISVFSWIWIRSRKTWIQIRSMSERPDPKPTKLSIKNVDIFPDIFVILELPRLPRKLRIPSQ